MKSRNNNISYIRNMFIYILLYIILLVFITFKGGKKQHGKHPFERKDQHSLSSSNLKIMFSDENQLLSSFSVFDDPIDIVYTWVNGSDPTWIDYYRNYTAKENISIDSSKFSIRFIDGEELRFSLRSIDLYANDFIRYIFIIVANNVTQIPYWLNTSHPKIRIITHKMIFGDMVPPESYEKDDWIFNFNSISIENCISNIPDLANKFIYFNDDCFIGTKVQKTDFFNRFDMPKVYVNYHNYANIEKEYKRYSTQASNDFAAIKYHSDVAFTISTFKDKFGNATNFEQMHVAYPTTKNFLQQTKEIFNDSITDTIKAPFRRTNDIVMQYITFQYGIYKNKIVPVINDDTETFFSYGNIETNTEKFIDILNNKIKLFCINIDIPSQTEKSKAFLYLKFPNRSSFELADSKEPRILRYEKNYWNSIIKEATNNSQI